MTRAELRRWALEAYKRGCGCTELAVLADACEEAGEDGWAAALRWHAASPFHGSEPEACSVLCRLSGGS